MTLHLFCFNTHPYPACNTYLSTLALVNDVEVIPSILPELFPTVANTPFIQLFEVLSHADSTQSQRFAGRHEQQPGMLLDANYLELHASFAVDGPEEMRHVGLLRVWMLPQLAGRRHAC